MELGNHLDYMVEVQEGANCQNRSVSTHDVPSAIFEDYKNQDDKFNDAELITPDVVSFLEISCRKRTPFPLQVTFM